MTSNNKRARSDKPSSELALIASRIEVPLVVSGRDVRSWVDGNVSVRSDRRASALRRATEARRLFDDPLTPALASWLTRYARPPRLEVALVEAHRIANLVRVGRLEPDVAVAILRRAARIAWREEQADATDVDLDAQCRPSGDDRSADSVAADAVRVLITVGIHPSPRLRSVLEDSVDQAVDYLSDEASRHARTGTEALEAVTARKVSSDRRASQRVATGQPAGDHLRRILLGVNGLVDYALRWRLAARAGAAQPTPAGEVVRRWAVALDRIERSLTLLGADSAGAVVPRSA